MVHRKTKLPSLLIIWAVKLAPSWFCHNTLNLLSVVAPIIFCSFLCVFHFIFCFSQNFETVKSHEAEICKLRQQVRRTTVPLALLLLALSLITVSILPFDQLTLFSRSLLNTRRHVTKPNSSTRGSNKLKSSWPTSRRRRSTIKTCSNNRRSNFPTWKRNTPKQSVYCVTISRGSVIW